MDRHPYRELHDPAAHLREALFETPRDAALALDDLRETIDTFGLAGTDRQELAEIVGELATGERALRDSCQPRKDNAVLFSTGAAGLGAWVAIGNAPHGGYLIALVIVALVVSRRIAAEADQWLRIADDTRKIIDELRAAIRALPPPTSETATSLTGVRAAEDPPQEGAVAEGEETAQTRERRERTP